MTDEPYESVPCVAGSLLARVFCMVHVAGCGHVYGLSRGS